uniref:Uncharacterized protein n=1 Tax=Dickeya chrysanthemi TaxID=556 RepID=Q84B98_DICCH|nr:unknown [Dickeya chrysanthemi]
MKRETSCLSPEASLWLVKFVPNEFVTRLPSSCNSNYFGYRYKMKKYDLLRRVKNNFLKERLKKNIFTVHPTSTRNHFSDIGKNKNKTRKNLA